MHHHAHPGDLSRTIEAYADSRALDFPPGQTGLPPTGQTAPHPRRPDPMTAMIEAVAGYDTPCFGERR